MDITRDYIHGDKFEIIADFIWSDSVKDIIDNDGIILCYTHYLNELFDYLRNKKHKCLLISHNSDDNISEELYRRKSDCIKVWYGQNRIFNCDVTPLPIGIERPIWGNYGDMSYVASIKNSERKVFNKYLLAVNINNNPGGRQACIDYYRSFKTVTYLPEKIPFKEYVKLLYTHKYVISPPGHGYDCHRTWEAMYLGVIPIVFDMDYFSDLPLISVHEWKDITDEVPGRCIDKLDINYWMQRIKDGYSGLD